MASPSSSTRVLVIDDNRAIHSDFRKVLADPSSKPEEFADFFDDGQRAAPRTKVEIDATTQGESGYQEVQRAVAEERPYAVAFVDMRMPPGWDGLRTAEAILCADEAIEVVICTAFSDYTDDEIRSALASPDRVRIVKKPFQPQHVRNLLEDLSSDPAGARSFGPPTGRGPRGRS